jgi:hypothetical protein
VLHQPDKNDSVQVLLRKIVANQSGPETAALGSSVQQYLRAVLANQINGINNPPTVATGTGYSYFPSGWN